MVRIMAALWALILVTLFIVFVFTSCNHTIIDTQYTFHKVHIYKTGKCYEIHKWCDYDGEQIQIETKDGDFWVINSNQIILVEGKCPICDK